MGGRFLLLRPCVAHVKTGNWTAQGLAFYGARKM